MRIKTRLKKSFVLFCVSVLALCGVVSISISAKAEQVYTVSPSLRQQQIDGWGTSLIWWASQVGGYTQEGDDGRQVREQIMEMIFGEQGLNYNIARYNVGGGENPDCEYNKGSETHMQIGRDMEGFKKTADGEYDWNSDQNQRWALDWVLKNVDEPIVEYFSNSPPWWMTQSGCASGKNADRPSWSNLQWGKEAEFAKYFVDVLEHLIKVDKVQIDYINPFNESTSVWWTAGGSQEGCYFSDEERQNVLKEIIKLVDERGLDVEITATDCTGAQAAYDAYNYFSQDVKDDITKLNYHLYENGDENNVHSKVKRLANETNQKVWMSEMGYDYKDHLDEVPMTTAFRHSEQIRDMLKVGKVNAYVLWQVVEELTWQMGTTSNYGPIKVAFYGREDFPELANQGLYKGSIEIDKQYYILGQYSKYIKQGYSIVDINDGMAVAAVSPDGSEVVIVRENSTDSSVNLTYNLEGYGIDSAEVIFTDRTNNWTKKQISASGSGFSYTVTPNSVTTFVLKTTPYTGAAYFVDDAQSDYGQDIIKTDRFYLSNGWSGIDGDPDDENAITYGTRYAGNGETAEIKFVGTGIDVYGISKEDSATAVQFYIDGIKIDTYNIQSPVKKYGSLFKIDELEYGEHTFKIVVDGGYFNLDGAYIIKQNSLAFSAPKLVEASMADNKLAVKFTGEQGDYTICYRSKGGQWQKADVTASPTGAKEKTYNQILENLEGNSYEVKIEKGNFVSNSKTVQNVRNSEMIYYVDCGAKDPLYFEKNEKAGQFNSVKDRLYGTDVLTGKSWGRTTANNAVYSLGGNSPYKAMGDVLSGDGNVDSEIGYKFEVGEGKFTAVLGIQNGWADSERVITVKINGINKGNYALNKRDINFIYLNDLEGADGHITINVSKNSGGNPLLGSIMILPSELKTPLYAAAELMTQTKANQLTMAPLKLAFGAQISTRQAYLYYSDGSYEQKNVLQEKYTVWGEKANEIGGYVEGKIEGFDFAADIVFESEGSQADPTKLRVDKNEIGDKETVTVAGITAGAQLIVTDSSNRLLLTETVSGSVYALDVSKLDFSGSTLKIRQRVPNASNDSEQVIISVPRLSIVGLGDSWSDRKVIRFAPSTGVLLAKVEVTSPSGKKKNVINNEYFYYRAAENGEYTVDFTTKSNSTFTQKFEIATVDTVNIESVFSDNSWTSDNVVVTFNINSASGVSEVYVNDVLTEKQAEGYVIEAKENGEFNVKIVAKSGKVVNHNISVKNIDKGTANFTIVPDASFIGGFKANINIDSLSESSVTAKLNGIEYGTKSGFYALEGGEYTLTLVNGVGITVEKTINVAYKNDALKVMDVNIQDKDGKKSLTVAGKGGINLSGVTLYTLGGGEQASGTSFDVTTVGKYMLYAETDGKTEAYIFEITESNKTKTTGCGAISLPNNSGSGAILTVILGGMLICLLVCLKRKGGKVYEN